jgi:fructuronate reductase
MARLTAAAWPALARAGFAGGYDRAALATGIVHLGAGAFFRAHVAVYTDAVLTAGDRRWGIVAASLRHADVHDALAPQDGLYTLLVRDGASVRARVLGAMTEVLVAPRQADALHRALAAPPTAVVTLTVTEKGYGFDADGELDLAAPDIAHDLRRPDAPRSAVGWVAAGLAARRAAGVAPFAVVCCDNLRDNGRSLRRLVLAYARRAFARDAAWIEGEVAFPNTMVDRIVPRTTPQDLQDACAAHGYEDAAPVRCEPFLQWVIERFDGPRPAWEAAGVQFVADVGPFEDAKLRLLNAAHTAFACFGVLLGHATIAQAATDADIAAFVRALMRTELAPTVARAPALDPDAYQRQLWPRFTNPALGHATRQVAMDTSLKLSQRHVPALRERRARGEPVACLALVLAGWIRFLAGTTEDGSAYAIDDPLAAVLAPLAAGWRTAPVDAARSVLAVETVFGDLRDDASLAAQVARHLASFACIGVRRTLRGAAERPEADERG